MPYHTGMRATNLRLSKAVLHSGGVYLRLNVRNVNRVRSVPCLQLIKTEGLGTVERGKLAYSKFLHKIPVYI